MPFYVMFILSDKTTFIELPVTPFLIYSTKYCVSDWSMTNASIGTIECNLRSYRVRYRSCYGNKVMD